MAGNTYEDAVVQSANPPGACISSQSPNNGHQGPTEILSFNLLHDTGIFWGRQGKSGKVDSFALNDAYRSENVVLSISQRPPQGACPRIGRTAMLIILRDTVVRAGIGAICRRGAVAGKVLWQLMG